MAIIAGKVERKVLFVTKLLDQQKQCPNLLKLDSSDLRNNSDIKSVTATDPKTASNLSEPTKNQI